MEGSDRISYSIDKHDRLTRVSGSWTAFALENDAPELIAENVYGRSLWEFITDATTERLYRQIVANVRSGNSARFGLRCDSPDCRRSIELTMTATNSGEVSFETLVLKVEPRDMQAVFDRNAHHGYEWVTECGWCNRIEAPEGSWAEAEDAVFLLDLFWTKLPPRLHYGICGDCLRKMTDHISRSVLPHFRPPGLTSH
ncbi:MAG: hypothetical protein ABI791_09045 [Acidobacteriota bacterium]